MRPMQQEIKRRRYWGSIRARVFFAPEERGEDEPGHEINYGVEDFGEPTGKMEFGGARRMSHWASQRAVMAEDSVRWKAR